MKDLIILVADKNAQFALKGALGRPEAMQIKPLQCEFLVHPGRDGGVRKSGPEVLALKRRTFKHALLLLDFEGSGSDQPNASALEAKLDERLRPVWADAAKAIVIEPELDVWMWGADHPVEEVIEWPAGIGVREWLRNKGFSFEPNGKPTRPKEAMEAGLRMTGQPRSSALYQRIAEKISLRKCGDEAFIRLRQQLGKWFPP